MSWVEKHHVSNFDTLPIQGLFYLDGDTFAQYLALKYGKVDVPFFNPEWLKNQKMAQVQFPSGETCDIWGTSHPESGGLIHIYGEMDLPYFSTRDEAWERADDIAQQVGYLARKRGEHQLEVIGHDDEHFIITYDTQERRMADIARVQHEYGEQPALRREPLLDQKSREQLPKLYTNEHIGLNALAQVKFFDPSNNWTWYASEASAAMTDGTYKALSEVAVDDPQIEAVIFFGLVNGFELELGYFSLSELEELGGGLQLPIERDRHFTPTALKDLQELHRRERNSGVDSFDL